MATQFVVKLNTLFCSREDDTEGHSEPYMWPALIWIDDHTLSNTEVTQKVGVTAPPVENARVVIKNDMRAGETVDIPTSVGVLGIQLEDSENIRELILVVALVEFDETPTAALQAGFEAFSNGLRAAIADNLLSLSSPDEAVRDATIEAIKIDVHNRVVSAIRNGLTNWEKFLVFLGKKNMDDFISNQFINFSEIPPTSIQTPITIPITLRFNPPGRLLFYRDITQNGTGDVSSPSVIGQGGWHDFNFLFSGGNGIIYAVDQEGRLLFYRDTSQNGTGDVSNPSVIGLGGWQDMKHLFSGGNGIIYAVDKDGRLLFYRDTTQNGTGDVSSPSVIGLGGWQDMKHLFSGGNGIIYAVSAKRALDEYEIQGQLEARPAVGPV